MPQPSIAELIQTLSELDLLEPAQLAETTIEFQQRFNEVKGLLDELARRGWVTPFQAECLLLGKGKDLVLGPYLLLQRVGQGGMGEVFKARHRLLNRIVALKITRKDLLADPTNERRFLREIQATARLAHPNIVTVYDAARIGDTQLFTMEYIEGADLAQMVRQHGPLPIDRACDYIRQAALGLQHAFEHGLVHRDIKPSNLLVTADGAQVKILDMGVVRLRDNEGSDLTATGAVVGTPDYLSPEQATNSRAVDIRADLYSLGCTFFHILAGHAPFVEGSGLEKVLKHLYDAPPALRTIRPEVPPELALVIEKLMAKKPADRYQQPKELVEALVRFGPEAEKPLAPPTPQLPPAAKPQAAENAPPPPRRTRRLVVAAVAIMLVLAGVGLAYRRSSDGNANAEQNHSVTNSIGMELIRVAPGSLLMGSPAHEDGRRDDEGPVRDVVISRPFYLAAHETTVRQFRLFVGATQYKTEAEDSAEGALQWREETRSWEPNARCKWNNPGGLQDNDHPVVCISRADAEAFCHWLGKKENRSYRLPTEAEWEYACRAGANTPYATGSFLTPEQARFGGDQPVQAKNTLSPRRAVGSFPANAWGAFDMHGNVWEWCADFYSPTSYREGPAHDPTGPRTGTEIVARGGSWLSSAKDCRAAARLHVAPATRRTDIGFRVLMEAGVR